MVILGKSGIFARSRNAWPPAVLIAGLVIHIFILTRAVSPAGSGLFFDSDVIRGTGCDFYAIYVAGGNLRSGRSVYEDAAPGHTTPCHFGFRYLPTAALLGVPFSYLAPRAAYMVWTAILEFCLAACLALLWLLTGRNFRVFAPLAFLWLAFSPLYLELRLGQYSLIQAFLVMTAAVSLRLNEGKKFALWFAASLCWKLNTWIALPSLIKARRFAPLLIAAAVIAVTSAPHFIAFPGSLQSFLSNFSFLSDLTSEGIAADMGLTRGNLGLAMLVKAIAGNALSPDSLRRVFLAVFLAGCVLTLTRKHLDLAEQLAIWLALSLLAYHQTWEHHFVMALPAVSFLGARRRNALFFFLALWLMLPTPYGLFRSGWTQEREIIYHAWKVTPLAGLIILSAFSKKGRRA